MVKVQMLVNFEFLGSEPIENVITFMNFRIEKAIFFGYSEVIESQKAKTENFLKKYCAVRQIKFLPLSHTDLNSVIKVMRGEIKRELSDGNEIYFDITGGESLILVAFGSLSTEFRTPMHMFDIEKNQLILLNKDKAGAITDRAESVKVVLDIDRFIELHGGIINYHLHKNIKEDNKKISEIIDRLWSVVQKHETIWNPFSDLCRACFKPDHSLRVNVPASSVVSELHSGNTALKTHNQLIGVLEDLNNAGAITGFKCGNGTYSFQYTSEAVKDCLWEGGSVLELYIYHQYRRSSAHCKAGIHIDWDGVIHSAPGKDVLNEVDVLTLNGNVPTFISCKSGKMGPSQTLHALYELQTVADRFGGKYARKVLVSARPLAGEIYMERAKEMKIDVKIMDDNK